MLSAENKIIAAALLAGVCSLVALGIVETVIGPPGQWGFVVAFVLLALFGAVLPQLYLLKTDRSVASTSRLGIVTVVLLVLASGISGEITGAELTAIWILVGITIALLIGTEIRGGYRQSVQNGDQ